MITITIKVEGDNISVSTDEKKKPSFKVVKKQTTRVHVGDKFVTVAQAAKLVNKSTATVYNKFYTGQLENKYDPKTNKRIVQVSELKKVFS